MNQEHEPEATRRDASDTESSRANRGWWDRNADEYQSEHGAFLGDDRFIWGPEGLDEADAALLGPAGELKGRRVLEIGAGAAQCSRWLAAQGARPVALDLSHRQLQHALRIAEGRRPTPPNWWRRTPGRCRSATAASTSPAPRTARCRSSPIRCGCCARCGGCCGPGGRFVFSVSHPIRWAFPDEPGPEGLSVAASYFDRTPYVEQDESGRAVYVEHHRTLGDRVRDVVAAGFRLEDLVEPEWPEWNTQEWGGWSPLRGHLIPGTAIFVCSAEA